MSAQELASLQTYLKDHNVESLILDVVSSFLFQNCFGIRFYNSFNAILQMFSKIVLAFDFIIHSMPFCKCLNDFDIKVESTLRETPADPRAFILEQLEDDNTSDNTKNPSATASSVAKGTSNT